MASTQIPADRRAIRSGGCGEAASPDSHEVGRIHGAPSEGRKPGDRDAVTGNKAINADAFDQRCMVGSSFIRQPSRVPCKVLTI
jgi:hypothetical protein